MSAGPKHVKQYFKRYQQTVGTGKYYIKELPHLVKYFSMFEIKLFLRMKNK